MEFASPILNPVCERLISAALEEYKLVSHVKEDINNLKSFTVPLIKEVLQDAEEKLEEGKVSTWHRTLKELLFDYEDILDEVAIKAALQQRDADSARLVSSRRAKVRNVLCSCFGAIDNILVDRHIAHQIKDVRKGLEERSREINTLGLRSMGGSSRPIISRQNRRETSSLLEPNIIGRDGEKEKIEKLLLESVEGTEGTSISNNVSVISIIGMGGLGKTTLVKLVYNDATVVQHFQVKMWVCVSNHFDVERITREMLDDGREGSRKSTNWNTTQTMLKEKIEGKRFLLVLDDMWEDKDHYEWKRLNEPLNYGDKGSKIIVTTRSEKVSQFVKGTPISLENLSREHLWLIFERYAFDRCDSNTRVQLEPLGKQIFEKLKGSPLAAETVGRLLNLNENLNVASWGSIMNSKQWVRSGDAYDILPILKLSYDHLSGHLKQCFAYCSLFPKDYEFSKNELVQLWMAQNFIQITEGSDRQVAMSQHFNNLLHTSLFQQSDAMFVMHDLIHDLAESVSADDCFRLDDDGSKQIRETVRHVSVVGNNFDPTKLKVCQHGKLRTLIFLFSYQFDLSPHLDELFSKLQRLRALVLCWCDIKELPESIGNLIHLRYIDLSYTDISKLPESICNLHNLQVMKLQYCIELTSFPSNMSSLINLRRLHADDLVSNIWGLGKLTALENLRIRGRKMSELAAMDALRELKIFDIPHSVETKQEAINAKLAGKKHLDVLKLRWSSNHDDGDRLVNPRLDEEVLECLQPANNIKRLVIKNYGGVEFPSWMNNDSFVSFSLLERVKLKDCSDCEVLPRLGRLPCLKVLEVRHMSKLRHVGPQFLGSHVNDGGAVISHEYFPSLEELVFYNMPEWEEWDATRECLLPSFLPSLLKLEIVDCPNLRQLPPLPPTLTDLMIREVPVLQSCEVLSNMSNLRRINADDDDVVSNIRGLGKLIALEKLRISGWKMTELAAMDALRELEIFDIPHEDETKQEAIQAKLGGKKHLDVLTLTWSSNHDGDRLVNPGLDQEVLECLQPANNIKRLVIKNYGGVEFPSWMNDDFCVSFSSLEKVKLEDCNDCEVLPRLGRLPCLKVLEVKLMIKLRHVGPQFLGMNDGRAVISHEYFPSLEELVFFNMPEWEDWDAPRECQLPSFLPRLLKLEIFVCPKLRRLPPLPPSLTYLALHQVPVLQSCEVLSNMSNLRRINADDDDVVSNIRGLGKLIALEKLRISGRKMTELAAMDALRELEIFDIPHEDETKQEAIQAKLGGKKHLDVLTLTWSSNHFGDRLVNPRLDEEVLECLQPANNVKGLVIDNYGGVEFPSWMNNDSFVSFSLLERVKLKDCSDCEVLPRLGRLPCLKVLEVRHMSKLRHVGPQFLGSHVNDGGAVTSHEYFPSLEELVFFNMPEWEDWDATRECLLPSFLPSLLKLDIFDCPKLRRLPPLPPSLTYLNIRMVPELQSCEVLSNMSNLRRINADDDDVVSNIRGLGKLIAFEELRISGRKMRELAAMDALRKLEIFDIPHEVETKQEAIQAKLARKKHLDVLTLRWSSNHDGDHLVNCRLDEEVLECLQPANNIKRLVIKNYGGVEFPSWMNDDTCASFSSLERVELEDCGNCEALPRLGRLPCLKFLEVRDMSKLRHVGPQLLGSYVNDGGAVISHEYFPSLKELVFYNMPEWEEWDDRHLLFLPRLLKLKIDKCPKLRQLPPLPPTVTKLRIVEVGLSHLSGWLELPSSSSPSLSSLKIINCPNLASLAGGGLLQQSLQNLVSLKIENCENLVSLPETAFGHLTSLTSLRLTRCPKLSWPTSVPQVKDALPSSLVSISTEMVDLLIAGREGLTALTSLTMKGSFKQTGEYEHGALPSSLQRLYIEDNPHLDEESLSKCLQGLTTLGRLSLTNCSGIFSLPGAEKLSHLTSLQSLKINCLEELTSLGGIHSLISLQDLDIWNCPEIQCLPSAGLPESLVSLYIGGCPTLEQRCERDGGPDWPLISHVRNIDI